MFASLLPAILCQCQDVAFVFDTGHTVHVLVARRKDLILQGRKSVSVQHPNKHLTPLKLHRGLKGSICPAPDVELDLQLQLVLRANSHRSHTAAVTRLLFVGAAETRQTSCGLLFLEIQ